MRWIVLLISVAGICLGGLFFREDLQKFVGYSAETTGPAESSEEELQDSRQIFAAGIVEGVDAPLDLRFESVGKVTAVYVKPGDTVKANQVLAELDPTGGELRIAQAEAQLQIAMAERDRMNKRGGQSTSTTSRSTGTTASTEDRTIADARVTAAEAILKSEQLEVYHKKLVAPQGGTILSVDIQPGEVIGPTSMERSIAIVNQSRRTVRAFVEELDALEVTPGQQATVMVSGRTDEKYPGRIRFCAPYVEPKSHRHLNPGERLDIRVREVVVELESGGDLLMGLPVEVFIDPSTPIKPPVHYEESSQTAQGHRKTSSGSSIRRTSATRRGTLK